MQLVEGMAAAPGPSFASVRAGFEVVGQPLLLCHDEAVVSEIVLVAYPPHPPSTGARGEVCRSVEEGTSLLCCPQGRILLAQGGP